MTWNKSDITKARKTPLVPVLKKRGYALRKLELDNYALEAFGKLIVKDHYWIWINECKAGNAIDFFITVEHKSFAEAMKILLAS